MTTGMPPSPPQPNIVFRADASLDVGGGHVMRCLTLADELRKHGAETWFACRPPSVETVPALAKSGHRLLRLPAQGDGHRNLRTAVTKADWLVVDHYNLDAGWAAPLRDWAGRILAIDDLANRALDCDLLLDQTYGRQEEDYRPWVPDGCEMILGCKFALLRPEFAALRPAALVRRRDRGPNVLKVLVTLGATDPNNVTLMVLNALDLVTSNIAVTVVMGANAPHLHAIREKTRSLRHPARLLVDVGDMAAHMAEADIAIGASGTSSWERCSLGLPTLAIEVANNQHKIIMALHDAGAIINLGRYEDLTPDQIHRAFSRLASDPGRMKRMSESAAQVCDGLGAARVIRQMLL